MADLDKDVEFMDRTQMKEEIRRLRTGIRNDRDATGHNLCWWRPELWDLLPEKVIPMPYVPPTDEFLTCCTQFRKSLDSKGD